MENPSPARINPAGKPVRPNWKSKITTFLTRMPYSNNITPFGPRENLHAIFELDTLYLVHRGIELLPQREGWSFLT